MQILATRHPVASDLRFITMAVKFVVDVEPSRPRGRRRQARDGAQPLPNPRAAGRPRQAGARWQKNLHAAIDAFVHRDRRPGHRRDRRDNEIDRLNASLFAASSRTSPRPRHRDRVLPLTSVGRYLERIGDHVKNLAEEVVFMVRATDVGTGRP